GSVPASSFESSRSHPWHCAARQRDARPTPLRGDFLRQRTPREPAGSEHHRSYSAPLAWTAAVVGDRRDVADGSYGEPGRLHGAQRRFPARAGSRYLDLEGAHPVLLSLLGSVLGGDLRRI